MNYLRQSLREFRSRPGVSAVAVVTLALGVAGATTMFATLGAAGAVIVPPGVDAERVGRIAWTSLDETGVRNPLTAAEFQALLSVAGAFDAVSASNDATVVMGGDAAAGRNRAAGGDGTSSGDAHPTVPVKWVNASFFRTLGFRVSAGREFTGDDQREGRQNVAVVSEAFVRRFPAHRLGTLLRLGDRDYSIVGILPDRHWFAAPGGTDVWLALPLSADGVPLMEPLTVTVRLRAPSDLENARARLGVLSGRLTTAERTSRPRKLALITLAQDRDKRMGFGLLGMLAPSLVVLLIACANVANLLLGRAARREREMAIRAALGATRLRLVLERLTESAWPAAAGGLLGVAIAFLSVRALRGWIGTIPGSRAAAEAIAIDPRALLFAIAVTAAIPFVFGLVPALVASRPNLQAALHQSPGRRKPRRGSYSGRDLLVVAEIGLAAVLVTTAAMFTGFFSELSRVTWGFDPGRVLAVELSLAREPARRAASAALVENLVESVRRVPGVASAANGGVAVLEPSWRGEPIEFEGCAAAPGAAAAVATPVDGRYFATLGLPLLRGRGVSLEDTATSPRIGVVSARHAQRCWPGSDPLGRRFKVGHGPAAAWATVVGVAVDALTTRAIETAQPVYVPVAQQASIPGLLLIRVSREAAAMAGPVRSAIRAVDPAQPCDGIGRVDEGLRARLAGTPVLVGIIAGFGALALALGALGVFSVTSYMVSERTREFGIRAALGASRGDVMRLVLRQAATIVGLGATVSAAGTLAVTRLTFPELAALALRQPLLWLFVTGLMALVAFGASAVPARRAMQVEPVVALRAE